MTTMPTKTAYLLRPGSQGGIVVPMEADESLFNRFDELAELIGCQYVEHVVALLEGKRVHMFVDESGHQDEAKRDDLNPRATALYHNSTIAQMIDEGAEGAELNDARVLTEQSTDFDLQFVQGLAVIVGAALVWPHSCPGWEPDGQPWEEYL
jgi:hypothetical protein